MNLRELKLLNSRTCCGYQFSANDITVLEQNNDYRFYGGRVEYYTKAKCPNCGKEVVLLLEAYDNSYRIIDIGIEPNAQIDHNYEKVIEEAPKIVDDLTCPNCGKKYKSKSGLASHKKSCK